MKKNRPRTYFVSYFSTNSDNSYSFSYGNAEVMVVGKFIIQRVTADLAREINKLPRQLTILNFIEMNPKKEVYQEKIED